MRHNLDSASFRRATPFPAARGGRFRRLVALFGRDEIEDAIELLIAYLDAKAGDPDLEGQETEDELSYDNPNFRDGAGCLISDPDMDDADDEEDVPAARLPHRDRVRRARCHPITWSRPDGRREVVGYRLIDGRPMSLG